MGVGILGPIMVHPRKARKKYISMSVCYYVRVQYYSRIF